ncbi:hypothetical protein [Insolitispirillum peregrinum]|uniref:Uncharacterized protein n=1 Tax=Insolitispirillum peregrinum TaxID=80876 RepID=A0A1N7MBF0_9PROT|nr:hypothetical protein [Insolitispirillum peregrinum]SIS83455.1 hypothetical protein SAMN05421779_10412 [Insolitispirillum peregrinum]
MAGSSISGVGSSRTSPTSVSGVSGQTNRPTSQAVEPVREKTGVGPRDPNERNYVRWEGRAFDLDAPRGTYLNILV